MVLKRDDLVMVVPAAMQMDPEFFPDPKTFNPENFSKENKAKRSPYCFFSFGQGPRACIGMRFAQLEAKMALATVLRKYTFKACPKTVDEIELDPQSMLNGNIGGLWVKIERRSD